MAQLTIREREVSADKTCASQWETDSNRGSSKNIVAGGGL